MSIVSTLLTGVSLVGKVCQGLSGAFGVNEIKSDGNNLCVVYDSDMTVGGATFYKSNQDGVDGKFRDYIFNPTTLPISVCLPNINNVGGIEAIVPPKKARELSLMLAETVPPDTDVMIGPISDSDVEDLKATLNDTAVKLCVNRLPLDGTSVMIGGVTISADANAGKLYVQAVDSAIGSVTYFSANSDRGISAEILDVIYPNRKTGELKIGVSREYDINFSDMGFSSNDMLGCRVYFSVANGNMSRLAAHAALCCEPPVQYVEHLKATNRWM
jgi:hypothetical protein